MHFAFGALARDGRLDEQARTFINTILSFKRLKVSKCLEFLPVFPQPGTKRIPAELFKPTKNGAEVTFDIKNDPQWFEKLPDNKDIYYLSNDVPMISFVKLSLNQLKGSLHHKEYGRLGIVLKDDFLKAKGLKPVYYYTEESLWHDDLVKQWNWGKLLPGEKIKLEKEILNYRKPASLFPSFALSVSMKLTSEAGKTKLEHLTYNRYPAGYDFRSEKEYRIVFEENVDYLDFSEKDLFMLITPNEQIRAQITSFVRTNWSVLPEIVLYPA